MLGIQQEGIKLTFDENLLLLEKYKAMHEEEILNSILDNRNITSQVTFKDAVQYYNEKFNNEQ